MYSISCCCRNHPFPTMPFVAGKGRAVLSISLLASNPAVHTRATDWHSSMCLSAASPGSFNSAGVAVLHSLRRYSGTSTPSLYYLASFPPAEHPTCVYHVNCGCFSFSYFFVDLARCDSVYSQGLCRGAAYLDTMLRLCFCFQIIFSAFQSCAL